jgi:protein required for attachment to host cells
MKPVRTWVLIADGRRARIVENLGRGQGLHAVEGMSFEAELPPNREIFSDKPGRSFESSSPTRHGLSTPDAHRQLKQAFARQLARVLETKLAEGAFDRCVLVAPPETMGDLRRELPDRVREKVSGELVSDLTKVPDDRLPAHLEQVMTV